MSPDEFYIAESQFSLGFLQKILADHGIEWPHVDNAICKETALQNNETVIAELISGGKGNTSQIYRFYLKEHPQCSAVVKLPSDVTMRQHMNDANAKTKTMDEATLEAAHEATRQMIAEVHRRELLFYRLAGNKFHSGPMKIPRFFYGQDWDLDKGKQGVLFMEDLSGRCAMTQVTDGLNRGKVLALVDAIAHLQAETATRDEAEMARLSPVSAYEAFARYGKSSLEGFVAKNPGVLSGKQQSAIESLCSSEAIRRILLSGQSPDRVIVHGDLWPNNILWSASSASSTAATSDELLALFDWQAAHYGSLTTDLAGILGVSCDGEFRRRHTKEIIEFYFTQLKTHCQSSGREVNITLEQVQSDYRESQHFSILQMVMTAMMNPDKPTSEDDQEGVLSKRFRMLVEDVFPD